MAYSELIKSFGRIRDYMRQFYVYGFRSREEYDRKSARSYDNERRRIESWLGGYMDFRQDANGRRVFISVDSRQASRNPLYRAFKAKSFTDRDIILHFCILDLLADGDAFTTREISEMIDCITPDESTIRKKLREYEALGLVVSEKRGKELYYRRSSDRADIGSWREALDFYSESHMLGVVGSYIADRLDEDDSVFRFKHHYILQALESEILYRLLSAISERRQVKLAMFSPIPGSERSFIMTPLRIRVSLQEGRCYLLACNGEGGAYRPVRLDRIQDAEPLDAADDFDGLLAGLDGFCAHLWGASTGSGDIEQIEMTLHAGDDEPHILQRLLREKRCGHVEVIDKNTLRFTADVYDAMELMPWLRTFTGRILSLECSNAEIKKRFTEDLEAVWAMYGGDGNAVQ